MKKSQISQTNKPWELFKVSIFLIKGLNLKVKFKSKQLKSTHRKKNKTVSMKHLKENQEMHGTKEIKYTRSCLERKKEN
jgi:hypothetical protein